MKSAKVVQAGMRERLVSVVARDFAMCVAAIRQMGGMRVPELMAATSLGEQRVERAVEWAHRNQWATIRVLDGEVQVMSAWEDLEAALERGEQVFGA